MTGQNYCNDPHCPNRSPLDGVHYAADHPMNKQNCSGSTPPRPPEGKHTNFCHWKAKSEGLEALNAKLVAALEYIELTGGNMGHFIDLKGAPCGCGGCMANEASKALLREAAK
jgi:hypothetical protein